LHHYNKTHEAGYLIKKRCVFGFQFWRFKGMAPASTFGEALVLAHDMVDGIMWWRHV
jgi:hypothetical protein